MEQRNIGFIGPGNGVGLFYIPGPTQGREKRQRERERFSHICLSRPWHVWPCTIHTYMYIHAPHDSRPLSYISPVYLLYTQLLTTAVVCKQNMNIPTVTACRCIKPWNIYTYIIENIQNNTSTHTCTRLRTNNLECTQRLRPGASIPMGQGGHVPPIFGLGALSQMPPPQYF